jgi:clan AA aspartic protease
MITGHIENRRAYISIPLQDPNSGRYLAIEFVLDTGFIGFLTLPVAAVEALQLPYVHTITGHLADGQRVPIDVYRATIRWDDKIREVEVLATGENPLLGNALFEGHRVTLEYQAAGTVGIVRIERI